MQFYLAKKFNYVGMLYLQQSGNPKKWTKDPNLAMKFPTIQRATSIARGIKECEIVTTIIQEIKPEEKSYNVKYIWVEDFETLMDPDDLEEIIQFKEVTTSKLQRMIKSPNYMVLSWT